MICLIKTIFITDFPNNKNCVTTFFKFLARFCNNTFIRS